MILNFRLCRIVLCCFLGNSRSSEFYMPTFRNTLFHVHRHVVTCLWTWSRMFRNVGIQKSEAGEVPRRNYTTGNNKFQVSLYQRLLHLLMDSEEADFQVFYIAVTVNVIYFHSCVLYFRYIVGLFSCCSDCIGLEVKGAQLRREADVLCSAWCESVPCVTPSQLLVKLALCTRQTVLHTVSMQSVLQLTKYHNHCTRR